MNSIDYIFDSVQSDKKITPSEAIILLNSELYRNIFIKSYSYFEDMNLEKIKTFIDSSFTKERVDPNLTMDMLDLCCVISYFKTPIFEKVRNYLDNNSNYLIKLSALDYINNFYYHINGDEYKLLNARLNSKTYNELVKFQTNINLMLYEFEKYKSKVFKTLMKDDAPLYYFYRFANTLAFKQFQDLNIKPVFLNLLESKTLSANQFHEISEILN